MLAFLETVAEYWLAWAIAASWQLALLVAAVALVAWAARRASPRVRYALWLLVLVKAFLPPSLTLDWGVGNWGLSPLWKAVQPAAAPQPNAEVAKVAAEDPPPTVEDRASVHPTPTVAQPSHPRSLATMLFIGWAAGCLLFFLLVFQRYQKLRRSLNQMKLVDEGPLRIRFEKIALELGESHLPDLYVSDEANSPFLFGLGRPSIVLPQQVVDSLSPTDINSILQHELNHWRWRDPWVGWVQVLAQGLFWFHPLVWLANTRLRHERECVCDEAVLRTGRCEPARYGEALLAVLSAARGRSPVQGGLVGVFEPGANIQSRLEEIMNYEPGKRPFGMLSYLTVATFAVLFLPMALPSVSAEVEEPTTEKVVATEPKVRIWPWIAKTIPAVGATDVDPALTEIVVTFDRDMTTGRNWSWTGSEEFFMPPIPKDPSDPSSNNTLSPYWRDARTCALPVKLAKGKYYRVGINSSSFHGFKSADGSAVPSAVIYFTTKGASKSVQARVRVPKIAKLVPENGASDANPSAKALRATFTLPMGQGMSWTGGGSNFPTITPNQKTKWTGNGKTCVLPVTLKPGHQYQLGLNSYSHKNFQSKWGVPLEPVVYRFQTAAEE